ncbi:MULTISPECIES: hypothetical protein [Sphingomonas]|uniref:Uncharacterized protein n=1 Tax=Sphingomonas zeae TaxID=1646122 RepID=A0A7Y6B3K3_9SPHN|nr:MULTISPECIES: hypothetical protein [Sphingomonas]MBB4048394.1 hypothetical protein [Sphingomonas zeae]MDK8186280.1 hypothetical protein [Sphingomonas zeae]MDK8215802.1 hypothetical protein [Sphingomonas sp. UMB7805-LC452B]NUU46797.1 hypothetical protein [Sphingomonas zeae]
MKRLAIAMGGGVAMALIAVATHPASDRTREVTRSPLAPHIVSAPRAVPQ